MKSIAYHSKVHLDTREFHIHTGSLPEKEVVISEIFEKGQFITSRKLPFPIRTSDGDNSKLKYLKAAASELHNEIIDEVKMLFFIDKKIKPLKKLMPHFKLGSLFYYRNILEDAISNFEQVIILKNDFIPAYVRLGKCYIKQGEYAKATGIFEQGTKLNPEFPDLLNSLGVAYSFDQQYEKATEILQKVIKQRPDFTEANFNLGVVLFLSTLKDADNREKAIVPSRVIRYLKVLSGLERYADGYWQNLLKDTLEKITEGNIEEILSALSDIQMQLVTHIKIDVLIESFYLKFMYGGHEMEYNELASYERRISRLAPQRENFADYWNELGIVHIIQCRNLFLKSVEEFEKAVYLNKNYDEASHNLELIKNVKQGFLILLRAILK